MSVVSERLAAGRGGLVFILLIALSLGIGIYAGYRSVLTLKNLFYIIVLTTVLMLGYLLLLRSLVYGLLVYFYGLIFLNLYWSISLPGKLPDLDAPRLMFTFFWIVFLMEVGLGRRILLPRTNAEVAMMLVVMAIIGSMIHYRVPRIRLLLNGFAIPYAMFTFAKNVFATKESINKFLYFVAVPLSFYFPMNHIFERFGMDQFVFPRYIVNPQVQALSRFTGERTVGAFLQPVATGFAMICMFLLSLYALSQLKGYLPRIASVFLCMITPVAVFVIYTRSIYLGFTIALIILAVFSKRLRIYATVIIIAAVLGVMANWQNVKTEKRASGGLAAKSSAVGRLVLLEASLRLFVDHPFAGVGFDQYEGHRLQYVRQVRTTLLGVRESWIGKGVKQHNQLLLILTELGLSGFVPMCLMYYFIIRMLIKARRVHSGAYDTEFVIVVGAIFAEYFTNAMFMNPSFFEFLNAMPMVLVGIVVGGYQRASLRGWNNNWNGERGFAGEGTIR